MSNYVPQPPPVFFVPGQTLNVSGSYPLPTYTYPSLSSPVREEFQQLPMPMCGICHALLPLDYGTRLKHYEWHRSIDAELQRLAKDRASASEPVAYLKPKFYDPVLDD
jgi:hypothetical protein